MKPKSFKTREAFRAWLSKHHSSVKELTLRLFKVNARHRGIGYREALDESLCWGWIDGVRRALDADSFTQRFTPRKPKSTWSRVNIKRYKELLAEKRVAPPGIAAFKKWDGQKAPYSFENKGTEFSPSVLKRIKAKTAAWEYFSALPPGYRRLMAHWIMTAKQEQTRESRLAILLKWFALGKRIPLLGRDR